MRHCHIYICKSTSVQFKTLWFETLTAVCFVGSIKLYTTTRFRQIKGNFCRLLVVYSFALPILAESWLLYSEAGLSTRPGEQPGQARPGQHVVVMVAASRVGQARFRKTRPGPPMLDHSRLARACPLWPALAHHSYAMHA